MCTHYAAQLAFLLYSILLTKYHFLDLQVILENFCWCVDHQIGIQSKYLQTIQ